jgi:hypothetical protein
MTTTGSMTIITMNEATMIMLTVMAMVTMTMTGTKGVPIDTTTMKGIHIVAIQQTNDQDIQVAGQILKIHIFPLGTMRRDIIRFG